MFKSKAKIVNTNTSTNNHNITNIDAIISILSDETKKFNTPLVDLIKVTTNDPFKILIATVLSSRTKDEVTAKASARIFAKANSFKEIILLKQNELEKLIYPVGFYKTKAKNILLLSKRIIDNYDGKIPQNIDELTTLPGVGRKTANLIMSAAFDKDAICVDTHVHKIMNRIGYVNTKTPYETEMALRKKLPKEYWKIVNTIFVAYGQKICRPVSPHCTECKINHLCKKIGVEKIR